MKYSALSFNGPDIKVKAARCLMAIAATALLGACASMSPEECRTADWYEQGMRDGANGEPRSRLDAHREACGKVGVVPNIEQYRDGRAIGIRKYCTADNGLQQGRKGSTYQNVCPPELESRFLDRYNAGYRVYQAQQRLEQLDRESQNKQRELSKAKDDDARARLRRELKDLDRRLYHARDDVYAAERQLR